MWEGKLLKMLSPSATCFRPHFFIILHWLSPCLHMYRSEMYSFTEPVAVLETWRPRSRPYLSGISTKMAFSKVPFSRTSTARALIVVLLNRDLEALCETASVQFRSLCSSRCLNLSSGKMKRSQARWFGPLEKPLHPLIDLSPPVFPLQQLMALWIISTFTIRIKMCFKQAEQRPPQPLFRQLDIIDIISSNSSVFADAFTVPFVPALQTAARPEALRAELVLGGAEGAKRKVQTIEKKKKKLLKTVKMWAIQTRLAWKFPVFPGWTYGVCCCYPSGDVGQ